MQTRRTFLRRGAVPAGGALALSPAAALAKPGGQAGYGPLIEDGAGLLDLPRGFRYRVVQKVGDTLSNGAPVPGAFDGMVAFDGPRNATVLVRNHEIRTAGAERPPVQGRNPYDPAADGGTTAVVVGPNRKVAESYVSSSGTKVNCAGGGTPWGTWLTCEETQDTGHGFVFEVDPLSPEDTRSKTPIRAMGFFSHEAVDIDPRTGIAYLTEDDFRGAQVPADQERPTGPATGPTARTRSSFLFRYLPNNRSQRPGALQDGGKLQVMTIQGRPLYNVDLGKTGERFGVVWVDVRAESAHADALERGGARFQRLEGCHFAGGAFWFDDTSGGEKRFGQVFRLIPSGDPAGGGTDTLELFLEGDSKEQMDAPDNLNITPWGDIWLAEDGGDGNRIVGLTPSGENYVFAFNRLNDSEFAGPTFSRDGRTFFVNIQDPGHTFAIWGPWPRRNAGGQRAMAGAPPKHRWAPKVSGELREYAAKNDVSPYEAAAYERLGAFA